MPIPTLQDVKAQLNITSSTNDELLNAYLASALAMVEAHVGPSSVQTFTEQVTTRAQAFNLTKRPLVSITSVTPLLSSWPTIDVTTLAFGERSGTVWRKDLASLAGTWNVVYTAGYATFPFNYYLATLITVQHLWRTTRGGSTRPSQGGTDELNVHIGGTSLTRVIRGGSLGLPAAAMELVSDGIYFGGVG